MVQGHHGIPFATAKPAYGTYKSPYGPDYKVQPNIRGIGPGRALKFAFTAGSFGVVGALFALQFFSEVPKVRQDICQVRLPLQNA
ncbi:hypothetical protein N7G274_006929 [Stereocaulon virgatum]|uniref:Uncharacterized protein n=1 Tax=Stereocaulon virgatum TaxID=373712 RepID=A0ABR4A6C8_9LECA